MTKWIWQSPNYPNFSYNEKNFQALLDEILQNETRLDKIINDNKLNEIFLESKINSFTNEIINSAKIEGEVLKRESVRASLRKKLDDKFNFFDDKHATRQSDNYVNLLLDACLNDEPLSIERLHGWHNCLFESGYSGLYKIKVAQFRDSTMQVVSGKIGNEKVHYEAILAKNINDDMQKFLDFCNNSSVNPYIKSAIAHIWLTIIHPYDDGNGRIARAIANFLLPNKNIKFYSLSKAINANKAMYYAILEKTSKFNDECDITEWIQWHLKMTNFALKDVLMDIDKIVFKANFWDEFGKYNFNDNQRKFLNKILDIGINDFQGKINVKKYKSIANINLSAAQIEFDELCEVGCLVKNELDCWILASDFKLDSSYNDLLSDRTIFE